MTIPNPHYTRARKIKKHPVTGVYTTHAARKLRRRATYRAALAKTTEYGKDVAWASFLFVLIWIGILGVVIGGLLVLG